MSRVSRGISRSHAATRGHRGSHLINSTTNFAIGHPRRIRNAAPHQPRLSCPNPCVPRYATNNAKAHAMPIETLPSGTWDLVVKLAAAAAIGGLIGFERRAHHKPIGIAGMIMIGLGSTTYMLLAERLAQSDPSSISRTLQGFLSGIGFLGGAVIFKSGFDVKGIKAAAAVWITGALGLAIATSHWPLAILAGAITAIVMFIADSFPDPVREEKKEP
jgi:putative Mg2+ transporter-C (MgtC) family protein